MNDLLIIIALILLNGLFSMTEVALISARKSRLAADARNGNRSAEKALELQSQPDRFLSTVQIGITLIG
ncbi:MAG: CNNM domain-containing protein, partial [Muribaculaceae bacterium]|nr:CNNM domain-containing protein [Muribaculaceae bacterium]